MKSRRRLRKLPAKRNRNSGNTSDDDFLPKKPRYDDSKLPDFSNPKSLAKFIETAEGIIGNVSTSSAIDSLTFTTRSYSAQKKRNIKKFYSIIAAHPTLSDLSDTLPDPEQDNNKNVITKFVLLTRGIKTPPKKRIVNTCMILVAQQLRLKSADKKLDWSSIWVDPKKFTKEHAMACYQPNVTSLFHRHLFKYFHDEDIMFSQAKDFNFQGGFQAYWTELFTMVKHHRPDFGELPNKACFDIAADFKIRNNAVPPYTPYELTKKGYEDCMELMAHYACVSYCLRGATEVRTLFLFFLLSIQFLIPSLFVLAA